MRSSINGARNVNALQGILAHGPTHREASARHQPTNQQFSAPTTYQTLDSGKPSPTPNVNYHSSPCPLPPSPPILLPFLIKDKRCYGLLWGPPGHHSRESPSATPINTPLHIHTARLTHLLSPSSLGSRRLRSHQIPQELQWLTWKWAIHLMTPPWTPQVSAHTLEAVKFSTPAPFFIALISRLFHGSGVGQ